MEEKIPSEKHELLTEVVGFSFRKLLFTFKELTLRPGQTIAAYCDGERSKYVSAITYCLLSYGFFYFFRKSLTEHNSTMADTIVANPSKFYIPKMTPDEMEKLKSTLVTTFNFVDSKEGSILIGIPVLLFSQWLFYKSFRKSFFHHFYFILFVTAQVNLITTPLRIPYMYTLPPIWSVVRLLTEWLIILIIYFVAEYKFYPRITVNEIVIRSIGLGATIIIPALIWYSAVVVITFFIVQTFFS